jgi:Raf kinase inhibitor-like YbhB/YbcL family protein
MFAKRLNLMAAAAVALTFSLAATWADAAGIFTLKSSMFTDGKIMPKETAQSRTNMATNPNCVGDNVSPDLSWTNVPDGTKSFIIFVIDLEGRGGAGVDQWVAYGIPASVTGLAKGEASKASDKFIGGKNIAGNGFYSGPCTPPNTTPHHYNFVLIATDFDPKDLPPGLTSREVQDKLVTPGQPPAHTKGVTGLSGLFVNPWHK